MTFLEELSIASPPKKLRLFFRWLRDKPDELFDELREKKPLLLLPGPGALPVAVVSRWRDVTDVLRRHDELTVAQNISSMDQSVGPFMLARDSSIENWHDRAAMQIVLPIDPLEQDKLRSKAHDVVTSALRGRTGQIDLVQTVAREVPFRIVKDYYGFSGASEVKLNRWSRATQHDMFHNPFGIQTPLRRLNIEAGRELRQWIRGKIDLIRRNDSVAPGDTILEKLVHGRYANLFDDDERIVSNVAGLLVGTIETTAQAIVQAVREILIRPDTLDLVREHIEQQNWDGIEGAVNEALRFNPVGPVLFRTCDRAVALGEGTGYRQMLPPRATVIAALASAMYDAEIFPSPKSFDPSRNRAHYLHFGHGHHKCLGAHIGLTITAAAVAAILSKSDLTLIGKDGFESVIKGKPFPEEFIVTIDCK
ncbi:MAG: cytochrome P450 [Pseudomonadota bacterium]